MPGAWVAKPEARVGLPLNRKNKRGGEQSRGVEACGVW
jgi:hypothetical protein